MSLREQQNLLAKLYTDEHLRRAFSAAPRETGAIFQLNAREIDEIAAVMPEELEFFAESLFWKRLREAEKFTPHLKKFLKNDFAALFREFSQKFNPQTVKKHFEDAVEFCRFLQRQKISNEARNLAKYEQCRLEFFGFEKRLAICLLDFDLREIDDSPPESPRINLKNAKKLAVWLRTGKRIRHFFI